MSSTMRKRTATLESVAMGTSMRMQMRIIENCAPTLAGMKSASLFSYEYNCEEDVKNELWEINRMLNDRGITAEILAWREKSVLIYVYRPRMLAAEDATIGMATVYRMVNLLEEAGIINRKIHIAGE